MIFIWFDNFDILIIWIDGWNRRRIHAAQAAESCQQHSHGNFPVLLYSLWHFFPQPHIVWKTNCGEMCEVIESWKGPPQWILRFDLKWNALVEHQDRTKTKELPCHICHLRIKKRTRNAGTILPIHNVKELAAVNFSLLRFLRHPAQACSQSSRLAVRIKVSGALSEHCWHIPTWHIHPTSGQEYCVQTFKKSAIFWGCANDPLEAWFQTQLAHFSLLVRIFLPGDVETLTVFRVKWEISQPNLTASGDGFFSVSHLSYDNGFRALLKHCQKPEIFKPVSFILFLAVQTPYRSNITQAGSSKNFMKVLHKASHLAAHFAALEWLWPQGLCKWSNSEMENDGRCKPFHCIPNKNLPKHGVNLSSPTPSSPSHLTPT